VLVGVGVRGVNVSVAGTLVDVLSTVPLGDDIDVGGVVGRAVGSGLEILQERMLRIKRARTGRCLVFTP
jgi:hypothetical protein